MIEVFKTNVKDRGMAEQLIDQIHKTFLGYQANFDLQDCDNILRVKSMTGLVEPTHLIYLLKEFGYKAEVLVDEVVQFAGMENQ